MITESHDTEYYKVADSVRKINSGFQRKATVITFGCQQNEADSEHIRGILFDMGYENTEDYSAADVIILNTCAIRGHAEEKAFSFLGNFKALKKNNPSLIVGVCGCMAAEAGALKSLKENFHYVTFTLEPNMLHRLPSLILKSLTEGKRSFIIGEDTGDIIEGLPTLRMGGHRAWVSVMYGCNNFCSYCIVPYVRGRERSRRSADIISECRSLIASGVREITLLGQNVNSYYSDLCFADLLEKIALIEGDFIIRFMTSHPKDVSDRLIEVIGRYSPKIAPYFHLPLQSGSNRVLKAMNRSYTKEKFLEIVDKLRTSVPDIAISTDVIIGFPTEHSEDFFETMEIIRKVRFDMAYSFIYSPREGTRAALIESVSSDEERADRMKEFLDVQGEISYEKNLPYVGRTVRVLVDSVSKRGGDSTYSARTDSNKLVHFTSAKSYIGEFINLKITRVGAFDLFGEIT